MKINEIMNMPTVINNTHQSVYRCYHTLQKVKDMLKRKDSQKSILNYIELLEKEELKQ